MNIDDIPAYAATFRLLDANGELTAFYEPEGRAAEGMVIYHSNKYLHIRMDLERCVKAGTAKHGKLSKTPHAMAVLAYDWINR